MKGILKLKQNELVDHPDGGHIFGVIPAIVRLGAAEALIYLKAGMHRSAPGRAPAGYGVKHIWEGKKRELRSRGCTKPDDVPRFVADLIVLGAEIYHDPAHDRADMKRITILRTQDGTLLLEPLSGDRNLGFHYSVVTWTPRSTPKGIQVGTIDKTWAEKKRPEGRFNQCLRGYSRSDSLASRLVSVSLGSEPNRVKQPYEGGLSIVPTSVSTSITAAESPGGLYWEAKPGNARLQSSAPRLFVYDNYVNSEYPACYCHSVSQGDIQLYPATIAFAFIASITTCDGFLTCQCSVARIKTCVL